MAAIIKLPVGSALVVQVRGLDVEAQFVNERVDCCALSRVQALATAVSTLCLEQKAVCSAVVRDNPLLDQ